MGKLGTGYTYDANYDASNDLIPYIDVSTLQNKTVHFDDIASGSGGAGINRSVSVISSPTTAGAAADTDYIYLVSGTTTLTMPTAVGNTNRYTIKNVGSNTVTIATTSSQTIDGSSTATMPVANTSLDIVSDGSNWLVI